MDPRYIALLQDHAAIICFAGAFFGGTTFTLFFSTIAGQGVISFWIVFFFAFLGNFLSDYLWFLFGRAKLVEKITYRKFLADGYHKVRTVQSKYKRSDLLIFVVAKFIYGIRILTIIYFGRIKYGVKRFLKFNTMAVFIITSVVVFSGWMVGKGVKLFLDVFLNLQTVLTFALAVVLVYHIVKALIQKIYIKI